MNKPIKPQEWQTDPDRLISPDGATVCYWRNGSMLTATMPISFARQLIREGMAFIISKGHIGALDHEGNCDA